jgi:hypothetical protein
MRVTLVIVAVAILTAGDAPDPLNPANRERFAVLGRFPRLA